MSESNAHSKKPRRFVYLPEIVWEWLDRVAIAETERQGGTVRQGGAGKVSVSHLIERLARNEAKRFGPPLMPEVPND